MFPPDANQSRENGGRGSRRSSRGHGANARGRVQSQFGDLQLQIDALERELSTRLSTKIGEMFVQAVFRCSSVPQASSYLDLFRELLSATPTGRRNYSSDVVTILETSKGSRRDLPLITLVSGINEVLRLNPSQSLWESFVGVARDCFDLQLNFQDAIFGYCDILKRHERLPFLSLVVDCYRHILPFVRNRCLIVFAESAERALAQYPRIETVRALRCTWESYRLNHEEAKREIGGALPQAPLVKKGSSLEYAPGSVLELLRVLEIKEFRASISLLFLDPSPLQARGVASGNPLHELKMLARVASLNGGDAANRVIAESHRTSLERGEPYPLASALKLVVENSPLFLQYPEAQCKILEQIQQAPPKETHILVITVRATLRLLESSSSPEVIRRALSYATDYLSGADAPRFLRAIRGLVIAFPTSLSIKQTEVDGLIAFYLDNRASPDVIERAAHALSKSGFAPSRLLLFLEHAQRFLGDVEKFGTVGEKIDEFTALARFADRYPKGGSLLAATVAKKFFEDPDFDDVATSLGSITTHALTRKQILRWERIVHTVSCLDFLYFIKNKLTSLNAGNTFASALAKKSGKDVAAAREIISNRAKGEGRVLLAKMLTTLVNQSSFSSVMEFAEAFGGSVANSAPDGQSGYAAHVLLRARGIEHLSEKVRALILEDGPERPERFTLLLELLSKRDEISPPEWGYFSDRIIYAKSRDLSLLGAIRDMINVTRRRATGNDARVVLDDLATHGVRAQAANFDFLTYVYRGDALPAPQMTAARIRNPNEIRMRQETNQVFLRALDASDGVRPALRSHARRGLDGSSLLGKFGYDLAENCVILNAIRVDGSPGRTFAFEGIKLADAFAHDPRAEREGIDPLHAYKAALPWAAGEIEALKNTHFIVGRGCLIVFSTTREHVLDGIEYAYVVWFKNYLNIGSELAWLVPKEIIMDKIRGTGINWLDYVGPNPDLPDINQRDLNPDGLKDEARRRGLTILELDLSSFAGGLCNMYPTNASPHFERERGLKETRDLKGHVHKSHLLGGYKRLAPPELLNLLRYYELLHGAVGEVITSLQDRFDLFRIVLSLWNRNFTGSLASKDSGEEREGRVSLRQNGFRPQTRARMLELAYLEHGQRKVNP